MNNHGTTAKGEGGLGFSKAFLRILLVAAATILAFGALLAANGPAQAQEAEEVQGVDGKYSATVVNSVKDLRSSKDDSFRTFASEQKVERYAKKLANRLGKANDHDLGTRATFGNIRLYDAPYFDGWRMDLGDGNAVPDFRYLYCHLWCQNYNDKASSLWADNGRAYTIFYEHYNYTGERLYVYRGTALEDLALVKDRYGRNWDNRISSMSFSTY